MSFRRRKLTPRSSAGVSMTVPCSIGKRSELYKASSKASEPGLDSATSRFSFIHSRTIHRLSTIGNMAKRLVSSNVFWICVIGQYLHATNFAMAHDLEAALLGTVGEETTGSDSYALPGLYLSESCHNGDELSTRSVTKRPRLPTTSSLKDVDYQSSNHPVSTEVKSSNRFPVLDTSRPSPEWGMPIPLVTSRELDRGSGLDSVNDSPTESLKKLRQSWATMVNVNSREINEQNANYFYASGPTTYLDTLPEQPDDLQNIPYNVYTANAFQQDPPNQTATREAPHSGYDMMARIQSTPVSGLGILQSNARKRPCIEVFSGNQIKNHSQGWRSRQTAVHGDSTLDNVNNKWETTSGSLSAPYHPANVATEVHSFADEQPASLNYRDHSGILSRSQSKTLRQFSNRQKRPKISHLNGDQSVVIHSSAGARPELREEEDNTAPTAIYQEPFKEDAAAKENNAVAVINPQMYGLIKPTVQNQNQYKILEEEIILKTKKQVPKPREYLLNGCTMQFSWISTITNDDAYVPIAYMKKDLRNFWRKIHESLKLKEQVILKSVERRKRFLAKLPVAVSTSKLKVPGNGVETKILVEVMNEGLMCDNSDLEEKMKDLVERVGHISQLVLLAFGVTFQDEVCKIEQKNLLGWLEKQILSPENSLPVMGVINEKGTDKIPEFGNLQKEVILFLSNPKAPNPIKMKKGEDEVVFSTYGSITTKVAIQILQTYYSETNPEKWIKYFHRKQKFLLILESITMALISHTFEHPVRSNSGEHITFSGFPWKNV